MDKNEAINKAIDEAIRHDILTDYLRKHPELMQTHGFYADIQKKTVSFDVVYDFRTAQPDHLVRVIRSDLTKRFPDYHFDIRLDSDFSE